MLTVSNTNKSNIDWMVNLSYQKRLFYEKAQPIFWKMSNNSNNIQREYFKELFDDPNIISLKSNDQQAFLIAKIIFPPNVYDAGKTLMIDDFCVSSPTQLVSHGTPLINEVIIKSKQFDAKQILIVSGDHDEEKNKFLASLNLNVMSRWYSKAI